ncbi:GNAT family N-acetyltransferase, partial [Acinetobacter baumannii]
MNVRTCTESDVASIAVVFTESIHVLGASHYDASQRNAWAPRPADIEAWSARLSGLQTLLAIEGDAVIGFISYELSGHIEFLYTAPGSERRGVASVLYREVEKALPGVSLFTEASLVAKPFFLRHGFSVVEEQNVSRGGVMFRRYAMRKAVVAQHGAQADRPALRAVRRLSEGVRAKMNCARCGRP